MQVVVGAGDVAPLPGLHKETLGQAQAQVAALSELLQRARLPCTVALLGGRVGAWLRQTLGADAAALHPSVRWAKHRQNTKYAYATMHMTRLVFALAWVGGGGQRSPQRVLTAPFGFFVLALLVLGGSAHG